MSSRDTQKVGTRTDYPSTPPELLPVQPPEHPATSYLRMERIPHVWCPGCGIGTVVMCFATALERSGVDLDKASVVSGIGCSGPRRRLSQARRLPHHPRTRDCRSPPA